MSLTDKLFRSQTTSDREAAALAVLALWRQTAAGFREDEHQMEGAEFAERTAAITPDLASLPEGRAPDAALLRRMLEALVPLIDERISLLHARIDELAASGRASERELQTISLASSWQVDELERCRAMLMQALQGRETVMPSAGPDGTAPLVSQLLSQVINIQVPPPRPQASAGRRSEALPSSESARLQPVDKSAAPHGDHAVIAQALREVLDGTAQAPKLARALEDQELARRVADLAAEHRTYRSILQRIGVLPKG